MPSDTNNSRISRRIFLKYAAMGTVMLGTLSTMAQVSSAADVNHKGGTMLVLYFSHSGNTRTIAEYIHSKVGGDIIELKTVDPYPENYDAVVDQAQHEQQNNARPQITTRIPNLDAYDTVFIGFPNWWGTMPMPFFTLFENYHFENKNIIPFCTHEGSRFGRSVEDLKKLCPQSRILEGFEVRGSRVGRAQADVDSWLRKLGFSA